MILCLFVFTSFIIPLEIGWDAGFKLGTQTEQADFTNWMTFLPSNLQEEISPNPEALSVNA